MRYVYYRILFYLREPYIPARLQYPMQKALCLAAGYLRHVLPLDLKIGALYVRNAIGRAV